MESETVLAGLWAQAMAFADTLAAFLGQIDPQYLLLAMGILIWIQLGRIVRALKGGGGLTGCNDAQSGALLGAGVGALAGQAIGGDTEATVIGTAVGAGAGYIIGNESDKSKAGYDRSHYDY